MDYNSQPDCIFCKIVKHEAEARVEYADEYTIAFHPIDPVTPNHLLVIPKFHVSDFTEHPEYALDAIYRAGIMAKRFDNVNLITSKGTDATQSVMHLHFHIVPRHKDDGLHLPWTGQ